MTILNYNKSFTGMAPGTLFLLISESGQKSPQAESVTNGKQSSGARTSSQEESVSKTAERSSMVFDSLPNKSSDGYVPEIAYSSGEYAQLENSETCHSGTADDVLSSAGDSAVQSTEGQDEKMQVSMGTSQDSQGQPEVEEIPLTASPNDVDTAEGKECADAELSLDDADRAEGRKGPVHDPLPNDSDGTKGRVKTDSKLSSRAQEESVDGAVRVPETNGQREEALNMLPKGGEVEHFTSDVAPSDPQSSLDFQPTEVGTMRKVSSMPTIMVEYSGESTVAESAVKGDDPLQPSISPAWRASSGELRQMV